MCWQQKLLSETKIGSHQLSWLRFQFLKKTELKLNVNYVEYVNLVASSLIIAWKYSTFFKGFWAENQGNPKCEKKRKREVEVSHINSK